MLFQALAVARPGLQASPSEYRTLRAGDVRHSRADISKACDRLGYQPSHDIRAGLLKAAGW